ncbi:MAG: hypothetical protein ACE5EQ_09545 [Phycisphaerae bacterium]
MTSACITFRGCEPIASLLSPEPEAEALSQVKKPVAGIDVRISIFGSNLFRRSETKMTNTFGEADFRLVPGAALGVTDTITEVTGSPNNGSRAVNTSVMNDPSLPKNCRLPWQSGHLSIANLKYSLRPAANDNFNPVCNNSEV